MKSRIHSTFITVLAIVIPLLGIVVQSSIPFAFAEGLVTPPITPPVTAPDSRCKYTVPAGQIKFMKVTRKLGTATLYFTPVNPVSDYQIEYGYKVGQTAVKQLVKPLNGNQGTQVITISGLNIEATYAFRVVPTNGCAYGTPSNWIVSSTEIITRK